MAVSRERVVQNAEKYVSRGKIDSAIKEYRKLLAVNPNDISTLNRVGDLYARINRNSEAIDLFTQIAEQYADDGFFVKAIAIYKKIIKLDPTLLEIYEKLADLYHRQGLVNEARTQYQVLADYYLKHGRRTGAIGIYRRMADLEPDDPAHHVKLADLYQEQGQVEEALGEYRAIADLMLQHERGNEAARVYARALDVESEDIGFITDAVLKLKESGHVAAAAHFLSLAVERNPQAERVARIAGLPSRGEPAPEEPSEGTPEEAREEAAEVAAETEAEAAPPGLEEEPPEAEAIAEAEAEAEPAPEPEPLETGFELAEEEPAAAPVGPEAQDLPLPEALEAAEPAPFELDLDDDMPESMVTPPADMLQDAGRRGAAWEDVEAPADAPEPPEPGAQQEPEPAEEEVAAGTFEFDLDLEADGAELLGAAEEPPQDEEPAPVEEEASLDHDLLERTAAEVHPGLPEEEEAEDLLTEAEVLARYGIEEKALERLAELLHRDPENLEGYRLMVSIHLDAGRHHRVAAVAGQLAEVAERLGDEEVWPELRERLEGAGYAVEPGRIEPPAAVEDEAVELAPPAMEEPEAVPESAEAAAVDAALPEEEIDLQLDEEAFELPEVEFDTAAPPAEEAPEAEPEEPAAPAAPAEEAQDLEPEEPARRRRRADVDSALAELAGKFLGRRPKKRPAPPQAPPDTPPPAAEAAAPEPVTQESPPAAPAPPEGAPPTSTPAGLDPLRALGDSLRAEIDEGDAGLRPAEADPDDTGMSWLDEAATAREDQSAFTDEADFFDLGAELEQELSAEEELSPEDLVMAPSEQSLEDIVEGFKRGVAENLSPEDFDTHFNLGIAYREMGLLDEAIGEFQVAARDPSYLVTCASMLGLCFLEKGLPELAVKWYRRGLEAPDVSEDDRAGLLYDLGEAQVAAGDRMAAYHTFVDLYGIDTSYRDVVARLAELEPVR